MENSITENFQKNTGRSLEEWIEIVRESGLIKHRETRKYLQEEHGLRYGFANFVAHKVYGTDADSAEDAQQLVDNQYQGKEKLLPLYEKLITAVEEFGEDVELEPKLAYVSLCRKVQFAMIQPVSKTRIEVGINLKGLEVEPEVRLESTGNFNTMVSHRVRVETINDIDEELLEWLWAAYEQAG